MDTRWLPLIILHLVFVVCLKQRLTLDLVLADWLGKLVSELCGIHLPLYTQYWGYRCMLLVPGFYMGSEFRVSR